METDIASFRRLLKGVVDPLIATDAESRCLILTCIDYRYPKRIFEEMDALGFAGRYYHLAMAGGSHAANHVKHDGDWSRTFFDHLAFAVNEGQVSGIIIFDHLDCKAFHLYEGIQVGDLVAERLKHIEVAETVTQKIEQCYPKLVRRTKVLLLPKHENAELIAGDEWQSL